MGETSASSPVIRTAGAIPLITIFAHDKLRATRGRQAGQQNLRSLLRAEAQPTAVLKASAAASDKTAQALKEHCRQ